MAGIGVRLNQIFHKKSVFADLYGMVYSSFATVAPMFLVIGVILLMQWSMGYSKIGYEQRALFADTVLYLFIFSLLSAAPFNSVLSRYLSDVIYNEKYEDILPCFYVGLLVNLIFGSILAVPFCIHEFLVGKVVLHYVFTTYLCFIALTTVFYAMLYLSITKDYRKISFFFLVGMASAFLVAWAALHLPKWELTFSILLGLTVGFMVIASLEIAVVRSYFRQDSRQYRAVFHYFKKYWRLILINFLYTLGLYIHNFVFWTAPDHLVLRRCFVTHTSYDMATCLAMFTNISASAIFISRVEMHFRERYRLYTEAIIGGRLMDIQIRKERMLSQLSEEIGSLARIQFIVTVVIFLLCEIFLPRLGFGGETMQIYPLLCVGYYIMFLMYALILFLYYFDDLAGGLWTAAAFCLTTFVMSLISMHLPAVWYGLGLTVGAFAGWSAGYFRLKWLTEHLLEQVYCRGDLIESRMESMPSGKVFDRREEQKL